MKLKHYTNKVRNAVYVACAAAAAAPAMLFAENGETNPIDLSAAGTAADSIGDAIKTLITGKILDNVKIIIGASLVIWAVFLVVRYIRKGGK